MASDADSSIEGARSAHEVSGAAFLRASTAARQQRGIEYRVHEFGTLESGHHFTYWPGFTLNPAIWDLESLRRLYATHAASVAFTAAGRPANNASAAPPRIERWPSPSFAFDVHDKRFEQSMSLRLLDAGARVAYLPQMTFRHIGVNESAYVLSGDLRPWDRSADDK